MKNAGRELAAPKALKLYIQNSYLPQQRTYKTMHAINVVMCVAFSDGPMEAYVARNEELMQKQRQEEMKCITNVEIA